VKVCFVATEYFGWGKYGGFGRLTRTLATNLARRNVETHVLMPKSSKEQPSYTLVDGVHVHAFLSKIATALGLNGVVEKLASEIDADIYHSEEASMWTYLSLRALPNAKHVITCQDPPIGEVWKKWRKSPYYPKTKHYWRLILVRKVYDEMRRRAIKGANLVCSQTRSHIPIIKSEYGLNHMPKFLPNPTEIPNHQPQKSTEPTILFLARWDPEKRPCLFFEIARKMPSFHFVCAGKSHNNALDVKLRRIAKEIPNLECPGHIDPKEALEKSWILVNCSAKESLPVSFLEACAYKCAIVSCNDPDGFASNFGIYIRDSVEDYVHAITYLIAHEDKLAERSEAGYKYVKETHELKKVVDQHLQLYRGLLN